MVLVHEKGVALPQRDARPMDIDHPAGVTNSIVSGNPRSERFLRLLDFAFSYAGIWLGLGALLVGAVQIALGGHGG